MKEAVPPLKSLQVGEYALDLQYLLNAPYDDIREAAESIPAAIGWLGYQRACAVERLILAEQGWKEAESVEYFQLKHGRFISDGFGEKSPSEEALKRALLMAASVKAAYTAYARQKKHVEWLASSIDALHTKLDLVRSSEVTRRMEHEL